MFGGDRNPFARASTSGSNGAGDGTNGGFASAGAGGTSPFGGGASSPFGGGASSPFGGGAASSPFGGGAASSPFGGGAASSPFGGGGAASSFGAPASSSSPFGAASSSPFGAPSAPFGSSAPGATASPFGTSAPASSASPFGSASASPFGAPSATATPFAPAVNASSFGAPSSTAAVSSFGAFGASVTPTPFAPKVPESKSDAGFKFGAAQTTQTAFGSSPFGASPSSSSPFGGSSQTQASSAFGMPSSTATTPFGGSPFGAPTSTSPFGAAPTSPAPATQSPTSGAPFGGGAFGAQVSASSPFGSTATTTTPFASSSGFSTAFGTKGLSANASPFAPKSALEAAPDTKPFSFGDVAKSGEGEKKSFVPPKPRTITDRLNQAVEETSASATMGDEMGEVKGHIVGTCDLMCPEKEREFRSTNGDLEIFERVEADNRTRSSAELCIKKYTRIVDEIRPDMVRTKKGLQLAIDQLWRILDGRSEDFMTKSKFLWDRLRSIRQDLNLQQITDSFAVRLMEQMVRYTILAEHELCEETASATNPDGHNSHLNVEQLTKTLTSLRHMYDDHAHRGQQLSTDAEAEMYCYQLLLRIDSHGRYAVMRSEMLNDLRGVRPEVLAHRDVQFALECHRAYHESNVATFFRLVKKATYLQTCCLHKFFNRIRGKALELMNSTYGKFAMPLTELARLLHTDDIETEALCIHHGLDVRRGKNADKPPAVFMRESSFISPAEEFPISRSDLVTNKRAESYLLEIVGKDDASRILAKRLPSTAPAVPQPSVISEAEKRKKQADELRAKIAEREAALAAERAAILAKKKEIEDRKAAEKAAAEEAERKAKEAEEAAKRAEEEARAAEAKAKAEAEAAEAERRRIAEEAARARAEAEARALAEAERRRAEEEAERKRLAAEHRAREAAEAARLAAIAKAEAEERARQAAAAEAERLRQLAEENARRQAAAAKAARKRSKMQAAVRRLCFSLWRMNSKAFKRERLIDEALSMASPAPALNLSRGGLFATSTGSPRPTDALAQLRKRIESSRSPEFGSPLDIPQTIGLALHEAASMAAPSALVWKCLICSGAEADSGPSASARPRTPAAAVAAEWLRTKLSRGGSAHATEPGTGTILSLYGTRLPAPTMHDDDYEIGPLAWIIVRDVPAMMVRPESSNKGATTSFFILDCGTGTCDQHELSRLRHFHNAVKSSDAPLIILIVSRDGSRRRDIERCIESVGVEGALIVFLPSEGPERWHDEKLADMLVWAAERVPQAPRRRIAYLSAELEEALRPGYVNLTIKPKVSPAACVRAFNDALKQVEMKILEAVQSEDGVEWPPVEIGLVNAALPPPGWRSESRRKKVFALINSARLPDFVAGENPARAFIDYVAQVLPQYPNDYGRCILAQAQYDPHFHKLQDIPWVKLFQAIITLVLSGLESRSRDERIYLPPGHPSYTFTPYEPEPELLMTTPAGERDESFNRSSSRKRKAIEQEIASSRFEEIESVPLDTSRAAADDLRRRVAAQSRLLDASERWLAALAANAPGASDEPSAFNVDVDAQLAALSAHAAAERASEARLRALLDTF